MKKNIPPIAMALMASNSVSGVAHAGTITLTLNTVSQGNLSALTVGATVQADQPLKTGSAARAEIDLSNHTVARLGAHTIFNYSQKTNEIEIFSGTILFSKSSNGQHLQIKMPGGTAITETSGTTGFAQVHGKTEIFGVVSGEASVTVGDPVFKLKAGQCLIAFPGKPPEIFWYDLPRLVDTSGLFHTGHGTLPTQADIDREIAIYDNLVSEGFIKPPPAGAILTFKGDSYFPINGLDSAGNAHNAFNDLNLNPPVQGMMNCSGPAPGPHPGPAPGPHPGPAPGPHPGPSPMPGC